MTTGKKEIRAVVFDLGGVLFDLTGEPRLLSWFRAEIPPEEFGERWLASPAVRAFETGKLTPEEFARRLVPELSLSMEAEQLLEEFASWPQLWPDALPLVRRVPPRFIKATLSNTNAIHWPRIVAEPGFTAAFDAHFPSHLTGKIKPDPDAFHHVLSELRCSGAEVLFLDDNPRNVDAARRLGIQAVRTRGVPEVEEALLRFNVLGPAGEPSAL